MKWCSSPPLRWSKDKSNKDLSPNALIGIRAAIHRTVTSQLISGSINILKDSEFSPANRLFEVVCKSYYRRGNQRKPKHKRPIQRLIRLKSFRNLFGSTCVIIWTDEEEKVGGNLQRTHLNSNRTTKTKCMSRYIAIYGTVSSPRITKVVIDNKIEIIRTSECTKYLIHR